MQRKAVDALLATLVALLLVGTAVAKIAWLLSTSRQEVAGLAYSVAAVVECCLETLILRPHRRSFGLWLTFWGFVGAALVSAAVMTWMPHIKTCHCLGAPATSQRTALALQGVIVLLVGSALALQGNHDEAS